MRFELLDQNVGLVMNIFLIFGNIICISYNIPQMIQTYRTRSTRDINKWFIIFRIIGNTPFIVYSVYVGEINLMVSYGFSVFASLFIGYFKYMEKKPEIKDELLLT